MKHRLSFLLLCTVMLAVFSLSGCRGWETVQTDSSGTSSAPTQDVSAENSQEPAAPVSQPPYTYETQEVYAKRDGNRIYGVMYIPQQAGEKMPAVIFSHGFGGTHRVGAQYAENLAENGYVVYCFDFCGGSPSSQSDGSTLEMSLFTEQADLEAVLSMMQGLDYVDSENLFFMGTSQGGAVSAITAAAHPQEIRGMVLLYPAFVMVDNANQLFSSAQEIPDTTYFMWMKVGRAYFEPLLNYDIYGAIASYQRDVLILHGDADSIVPLSYSERAVEVYPSARLEVLPGAGHGFSGEDAQSANDFILEYLSTHQNKE